MSGLARHFEFECCTTSFPGQSEGVYFVLLTDATAVRAAGRRLLNLARSAPDSAPGEGIVVEQFIGSIASALVGGTRDPEFGPILVFGLRGTYAEAFADATCPFGPQRAEQLIDQTQLGRLLIRHPSATLSLCRFAA